MGLLLRTCWRSLGNLPGNHTQHLLFCLLVLFFCFLFHFVFTVILGVAFLILNHPAFGRMFSNVAHKPPLKAFTQRGLANSGSNSW